MNIKIVKDVKNSFVSSSRAAQLSGYSRDYIGQLCRSERVHCERVSGEWHVDLDSVLAYKRRFTPEQEHNEGKDKDVQLDLKKNEGALDDFISSAHAAKLTGYSQDYIGQLARSGAVEAKKKGRKWFIERGALQNHKKHNDDLLAAVQAEATGLYKTKPDDVLTMSELQKVAINHPSELTKSKGLLKEELGIITPTQKIKKVKRVLPKVVYTTDAGDLLPDAVANTVAISPQTGICDVPEVKTMPNIPSVSKPTQVERVDVRQKRRTIQRQQPVPVAITKKEKNHRNKVVEQTKQNKTGVTRLKNKVIMGGLQKTFLVGVFVATVLIAGFAIIVPDAMQRSVVSVANTIGVQLNQSNSLKEMTHSVVAVAHKMGLRNKSIFYKK